MNSDVAWYEANNLLAQSLDRECKVLHSPVLFSGGPAAAISEGVAALTAQAATFKGWLETQAKSRGARTPVSPWAADAFSLRVPVRIAPFGPIENQNDDAVLARLGRERYSTIKLLNGNVVQAGLYAYEILNFVNGKRTIGDIRDAVSAEYGPLPLELVADYLSALAEAKIIKLISAK